jgi:hypothetical protein
MFYLFFFFFFFFDFFSFDFFGIFFIQLKFLYINFHPSDSARRRAVARLIQKDGGWLEGRVKAMR